MTTRTLDNAGPEVASPPRTLEGVHAAAVTPFRDASGHPVDLDAYLAHVDWLAARGVTTIAAAAADGERYDAVDLTGPVALLVGNEGAGLPTDVVARAGRRITIPMAPPVASLNVAVAAGILLFEAARQRRR